MDFCPGEKTPISGAASGSVIEEEALAAAREVLRAQEPIPRLLGRFADRVGHLLRASQDLDDAYAAISLGMVRAMGDPQAFALALPAVRAAEASVTPGGAAGVMADSPASLHFVNGLFTRPEEALLTLAHLRIVLERSDPVRASRLGCGLLYNPGGLDLAGDFTSGLALRWMVSRAISGRMAEATARILLGGGTPAEGGFSRLREHGFAALARVQAISSAPPGASDPTVARLRTLLLEEIHLRRVVVLAAHSQGNAIVEAALASMPRAARKDLRLVGIVSFGLPRDFRKPPRCGAFTSLLVENDIVLSTPRKDDGAARLSNELSVRSLKEGYDARRPTESSLPLLMAIHAMDESYLLPSTRGPDGGALHPVAAAIFDTLAALAGSG